MGSPYASPSRAGGSAYAAGKGGGGSSYANPSSGAPKKSGHRGFLGSVGHFLADKTERAAADVKSIPGGLYALGAAAAHDEKNMLTGHGDRKSHTLPIAEQTGRAALESIRHPLRDPFQTATTLLPLYGTVGKAADIGTLGKLTAEPRNIHIGETDVPLKSSRNSATRIVQAAHDKVIQHALDTNPEGRLARYAEKRVGGSIHETARYQARMRAVPAQQLAHAAKRLNGRLRRADRVKQAALELTSVNTAPEDAARFHLGQSEKGVNPGLNRSVAKLYQRVADEGLLTKNEHGDVIVDAEKHPDLAVADAHLADVQGRGDEILRRYGVRTPEQLEERVNAPGKLRGGEEAAPGRGFVSYATSESKSGSSPVASAPGPVIGQPRIPITSKEFTGKGIEKGLVPNDITGQAARHYSRIVRWVNTSELRNAIAKTGSDVRRSSRDVLIRVPDEQAEKIPAAIEEMLGRKHVTVDDEAGIEAALQAFKEDLLPGLRDKFATDKRTAIGTEAPEGYRWVSKEVVGDMAKGPRGPRGRVARTADAINSAVTAATVYFKLGHIPTRGFTNASTNIVQGSANPVSLAKSVKLWRTLSHEDKMRALAAAGQHGYEAMPHEGMSKASRVAGTGANWYARHFDAPFRFNSIAYEARRAGFDTPEKFHGMLDMLEKPDGHDPKLVAKADNAAKAANRENIAYDRLNEEERRFIARAVWFYPWVKGTVGFTVNTALEHPFKAGALGAVGAEGRREQQSTLGELPSYENGLFKIGGDSVNPTIADFSTFSPFATPADVADALARPRNLGDMLNPSYAALTHLIFGLDQYGNPTNNPYGAALAELLSPTPEAQLFGELHGKKPSKPGMFTHSPAQTIYRALAGPGLPRKLNVAAAHKAAGREKSGR